MLLKIVEVTVLDKIGCRTKQLQETLHNDTF